MALRLFPSTSTEKGMKRQVSDRPACVECRRLHRACSASVRPCPRCIQMGLECIESVDNRTKRVRSGHGHGLMPVVPPFYVPGQGMGFVWPAPPAEPEQPFYDESEYAADGWSSMTYDVEAWERTLTAPPDPRALYVAPPPVTYASPFPSFSSDVSPRSGSLTDADDSPRYEHEQDGEFFRCPVADCEHAYRRKGDLKTHVLQRHKDRPDLPLLIAKPRSSKVGKPYPCTVAGCPSGFTRKSGLARHLRQKHESEPECALWLAANGGDDLSSDSPVSSPPAHPLLAPFYY